MNETTKELHQQADTYLDNNNLAGAYSIYQKICQLDTQDAEAFMMMGALDGEMGKIPDAMRHLEQAIAIDSTYSDAYNTLAQLYRHQGNFDEAFANAKKAVEYDPEFFEACSLLASLSGQLGHYKAAEEAAKKALAQNPSHNETRQILADALLEQERYEEAVVEFKKLLETSPGNAHIYSRMGAAMSRMDKHEEAVPLLEMALKMSPSDIESRRALCYVYTAVDNYDAAAEQWKQVIETDADNVESWANLNAIYSTTDNWQDFADFCQQQEDKIPYNKHVIINKGYAQEKLGQLDTAREVYFKLSELYPDWGDVWNRLGLLYISVEEYVPAHKYLKKALDLGVKSPLTMCMFALSLRFFGKNESSLKLCKQALDIAPELAPAYLNLGVSQVMMGDYDDAISTFTNGLSKHPDDLSLVAGIADVYERQAEFEKAEEILKPHLSIDKTSAAIVATYAKVSNKLKHGEDALDLIHAMLERSNLMRATTRELHFRCGDIYNSMKDYEKAIEQYNHGNALKEIEFDQKKHTQFIDDTIRFFTRDTLEKLKAFGNPSARPVFILGMPRSGTSLAEQILASHPDVYGAGELMNLTRVADTLDINTIDSSNLQQALSALDENKISTAAKTYLRNIDAIAGEEIRVTDKMPGNFLYLGLIQILFPNAKVIHTKRNALDNCFSCYCLDFMGVHAYSYDLEDLGFYYREYERLMAHWHDVLDIPILDVQYEEAVEDIEKTSRDMVKHCDLEWNNDVLNYHQSKRVVKTASYDQVNKPVYKTSVERWRAYEQWLTPLKEALKG